MGWLYGGQVGLGGRGIVQVGGLVACWSRRGPTGRPRGSRAARRWGCFVLGDKPSGGPRARQRLGHRKRNL